MKTMVHAAGLLGALCFLSTLVAQQPNSDEAPLSVERVVGDGVWVAPEVDRAAAAEFRIVVWFDQQFLGDGKAYERRAKEFSDSLRQTLREQVIETLQSTSEKSHQAAEPVLEKLIEQKKIWALERHWIVNGFSCTTTAEGVAAIKLVPGVKKIFYSGQATSDRTAAGRSQPAEEPVDRQAFDPERYKHPWYIYSLQADRVWKEFDINGKGTLNIVQDGNFVFLPSLIKNAYRNPNETADNAKDDDKNGLVDDIHGFNFARNSNQLTLSRSLDAESYSRDMHGSMCANIICGTGTKDSPYEFGIAPEARWAGVIGYGDLERAVEWAILQGADTYSMSFSIPQLGETRSHWRKVMEHGSFCGICFVSGAGNFAQSQPIPVQMRIPEDIPNAVFAAAGVQRDYSRSAFSSMGPVEWETEHYQDGRVAKPEVCAFNRNLPLQLANGEVRENGLNGNSFAGPMFCGSIALMLSADPDLLPWDLREIITSTATDISEDGRDDETGHGLINCYRAVKEVLRRKAIREGRDATRFAEDPADHLSIDDLQKLVGDAYLLIGTVEPSSPADDAGVVAGDRFESIDGNKISGMEDFEKAFEAAGDKPMKVTLVRDGATIEVELGPGRMGISLETGFTVPVFR